MAVATAETTIAREGKYLSFVLGSEEYGVEILRVQEIDSMLDITPVPRTPTYVRGVINLRGQVIPIVSLREYFRMAPAVDTEKTCVIVVQATYREAEITLGLVVDGVSEVLNIAGERIERAPAFGGGMEDADFITGMGRMEDRVVILLDIDQLLLGAELAGVLAGADC